MTSFFGGILGTFIIRHLLAYPPPPQWANLGLQVVELSQNCYLLYILKMPSKNAATIMTEHQKENLFVLTALYGGHLGGPHGPFLAQNSTLFYATPT